MCGDNPSPGQARQLRLNWTCVTRQNCRSRTCVHSHVGHNPFSSTSRPIWLLDKATNSFIAIAEQRGASLWARLQALWLGELVQPVYKQYV